MAQAAHRHESEPHPDGKRHQPRQRVLVVVDGPAGAGKSTVTLALSKRLGVPRLDTGAMYRAVTWRVLERGVDPHDHPAVARIAQQSDIAVGPRVCIDGEDITDAIRISPVNEAVSIVASNRDVRDAMVALQRRWVAQHGDAVVEGRDIGTVVLPDADLKVYLTATAEERARRRGDEGADAVGRRDHLDTTRSVAPLSRAPDARVVDTTGRSVEEIVEEILSWL